MQLTGELREFLELLLPVVGDVDALLLRLLVDAVESQLSAVEDQLLRVLRVLGGQDGEEVPVDERRIGYRQLPVRNSSSLTLDCMSFLSGRRQGSVRPCPEA